MRRWLPVLALAALAGCGGSKQAPEVSASVPELSGVQANPPAPAAAAALSRVPTSPAAEERFGYVNLARLADVKDALGPQAIRRAVLGGGADRGAEVPGARTAVQVGDATVLTKDASGEQATVLGDGPLTAQLANRRPAVNLIQAQAQSAVQTCLGDATAEVVLGPEALGTDIVIGAGLRPGAGGADVVLCYAPRLIREIDAGYRRIARRYDLSGQAGDTEIGEREMLAVTIPARALEDEQIRALLEGGDALRSLAR